MAAELHSLALKKKIGKADGLLHSLVPRAKCFCFYGPEKNCVWSSDGAEDGEIDNFVTDLPDQRMAGRGESEGLIRRTLSSGRTIIAFPVFADRGSWLGILIVLFSKNAGKSASLNPSGLKSILQPAIEMIGERLVVDARLQQAEHRKAEIERELDLLYKVDEKIHGAKTRHSSLAQLIGQSGRFLGIKYSVLLIPNKRIRISATHSSWKNVNRKVVDRYLVEQLLPKLEGQRKPVVFRIPAVEGSDDAAEHG